ncbi:MAG: hypothetical protein ACT4N4_17535, partial [Rhodospirillales bacterium]
LREAFSRPPPGVSRLLRLPPRAPPGAAAGGPTAGAAAPPASGAGGESDTPHVYGPPVEFPEESLPVDPVM